MLVCPNSVAIISAPNGWIDFKFGVWLYVYGTHIKSDFGCCSISTSCMSWSIPNMTGNAISCFALQLNCNFTQKTYDYFVEWCLLKHEGYNT